MREQVKSLKQERDLLTQQLEINASNSASSLEHCVNEDVYETSSPTATLRASASSPGECLTVGEAYQVAAARGLNKSDVTFRRWLKNAIAAGSMPEELSRIGLVADFSSRRGANPNSNLVRWLRFEQ